MIDRPPRRLARDAWKAVPLRAGLGRRILAWFLVLSLVPLFVSNGVGYLVTRRIIEGQTRRYLTALAQVQAQHVAVELEHHQLSLTALVTGDALLAGLLEDAAAVPRSDRHLSRPFLELDQFLELKLEELRPLSGLAVIDAAGAVIAATGLSPQEGHWADSVVFRSARQRSVLRVSRERERGRLRTRLWLAAPIRDRDGPWRGMLVGTVDHELLGAFLNLPPHLADHVHAYLVDRRGLPIFVSHPHRAIDYAEPFPSPLATAAPGEAPTRYVNYENFDVYAAAVEIPGTSWRYISEVSAASALGQLRTLALLAAGLESVFALLLVGAVYLVAGSIVAPLRRLVAAAERIREGDLGAKVVVEGKDELGDLGRTFNQMSEQLQASARQIQELHEHEMRRAAQLASVGELASGIAHEVKNPLVGVASGVDLLRDRLRNDVDAEVILGQIRVQISRMEAAIHDLLSYARPREPHLTRVDPNQLLDRVIGLVWPQAEAAGVIIEREAPDAVPSVLLDPDQLSQALVNLALNGIHAMQEGGVLRLAIEVIDTEVKIAVTDGGCGIPADQLDAIFRPFHTTKHEGTGLGLAITRGIVERHGGRLEVVSAPGRGSTFTIVLAGAREESLQT